MRYWTTTLVIIVPAIIGEAVFLTLPHGPSDYDASAELIIGSAVAGLLALAASLVFLRSRFASLVHAVLAAALIIPLWYAYAVLLLLGSGYD